MKKKKSKKTDICLLKRYWTPCIVAAYNGWPTTLFFKFISKNIL